MDFLYTLENLRTAAGDVFFSLVTQLGGELVFLALAITVFWCVNKSLGYYILTVGFVGTIFNNFLKLLFRVPRPWVLDPEFTIVESARAEATGYSFPSGHTQNVSGTFGALACWTKSRAGRAACLLVIALVAFSRMYLGVHTPKDVAVSLVAGGALALALRPLFSEASARPKRMYAVLGGLCALGLCFVLFTELFPFPGDMEEANFLSGRKNAYMLFGAAAGMLLSYWLDRRFIRFETAAPLPAQIAKVLLGLLLTLLIKEGLKAPLNALLGAGGVAEALRYFAVVLFAAGVWPMSFRRFFSRSGKKTESNEKELL